MFEYCRCTKGSIRLKAMDCVSEIKNFRRFFLCSANKRVERKFLHAETQTMFGANYFSALDVLLIELAFSRKLVYLSMCQSSSSTIPVSGSWPKIY